MTKCSVEVCQNKAIARGLCRGHYRRLQVHGDPGTTELRYRSPQTRVPVKEVLDAINDYWQVNYCSPTARELMELTNLQSTSAVCAAVNQLRTSARLLPATTGARQFIPPWVAIVLAAHSPPRRQGGVSAALPGGE